MTDAELLALAQHQLDNLYRYPDGEPTFLDHVTQQQIALATACSLLVIARSAIDTPPGG